MLNRNEQVCVCTFRVMNELFTYSFFRFSESIFARQSVNRKADISVSQTVFWT